MRGPPVIRWKQAALLPGTTLKVSLLLLLFLFFIFAQLVFKKRFSLIRAECLSQFIEVCRQSILCHQPLEKPRAQSFRCERDWKRWQWLQSRRKRKKKIMERRVKFLPVIVGCLRHSLQIFEWRQAFRRGIDATGTWLRPVIDDARKLKNPLVLAFLFLSIPWALFIEFWICLVLCALYFYVVTRSKRGWPYSLHGNVSVKEWEPEKNVRRRPPPCLFKHHGESLACTVQPILSYLKVHSIGSTVYRML